MASVRSHAKINIGLRIGPPWEREDGFHDLRTVYQTLEMHDLITVELDRTGKGIVIRCADPRVPLDKANTCHRMTELALEAMKVRGKVTITIEKRLPVMGGLGAASSNAVATLVALEREAGAALAPEVRFRIAEAVGSDVPLFLVGGTVLGIGRGEQVYPLPDLPEFPVVVALPEVAVSTPKAFADWDGLFASPASRAALPPDMPTEMDRRSGRGPRIKTGTRAQLRPDEPTFMDRRSERASRGAKLTVQGQWDKLNRFSREVASWLGSPAVSGVSARSGDRAEALLLDLVRTGIENDFESVVFPQFPELRDAKRALEQQGAVYASLSGSGGALYGLFRTEEAAGRAAAKLAAGGIPAQATRMLGRERLQGSH